MPADHLCCPWCAEHLYGSCDDAVLIDNYPHFADPDDPQGGMRSLYHPWCWSEYRSSLVAG